MNKEETLLPSQVIAQYLIDSNPRFGNYLIKYLDNTGQLAKIILTFFQKLKKDDNE